MTIISTIILGIIMGVVFGVALEKSRVFEPGIILEQMYFRKFIMLKVFLTAVLVSIIIFTIFFMFGFERLSWKVTFYYADVIGGILLGVGIVIVGGCPGTIFAQIGAGYKDAIATLIGGVIGAFTFLIFESEIFSIFYIYPGEKVTLDNVINAPMWLISIVLCFLILLILCFLEIKYPWKHEIGKSFDGTD